MKVNSKKRIIMIITFFMSLLLCNLKTTDVSAANNKAVFTTGGVFCQALKSGINPDFTRYDDIVGSEYVTKIIFTTTIPENYDRTADTLSDYRADIYIDGTEVYIYNSEGFVFGNYSKSMFCNFTGVTDFIFEGVDTSNVTSFDNMFYGCNSVKTLDINNWDTRNVTSFYGMFYNCTAIESLNLNNWDTGNVEIFDKMFYQCNNLRELNISNWDTHSGVSFWMMFNCCQSLTSLDLSMWNMSSATSISEMFKMCNSLETLNLSNWNTENVQFMSAVFKGCLSLTNLDITGWDTSNVTDMSAMFYNAYSLPYIDLSSFKTDNVNDMSYMFNHCYEIKSLDDIVGITTWNTSNVTDMTGLFTYCKKLNPINLNNWDTKNVQSMKCVFQHCRNADTIEIDKWDTQNVITFEGMFMGCTRLPSMEISKFQTGNATTFKDMFRQCESLETIDVSKWDLKNAQNLDSMFCNCYVLNNIDVSKWNVGKVNDLTRTFSYCQKFTELDLTDWDMKNVINMNFTFEGAISIITIGDTTNWNTPNLKSLCGAFSACRKLKELNTTNWNMNNLTNLKSTFAWCYELTTVGDTTNWNISKVREMYKTFNNCNKLKELNTENWTNDGLCTSFMYIFERCYQLTKIDLHNITIKASEVQGMFDYCSSLHTIVLPKSTDYSISLNKDYYLYDTAEKKIKEDVAFTVIDVGEYSGEIYTIKEYINEDIPKHIWSNVRTGIKQCDICGIELIAIPDITITGDVVYISYDDADNIDNAEELLAKIKPHLSIRVAEGHEAGIDFTNSNKAYDLFEKIRATRTDKNSFKTTLKAYYTDDPDNIIKHNIKVELIYDNVVIDEVEEDEPDTSMSAGTGKNKIRFIGKNTDLNQSEENGGIGTNSYWSSYIDELQALINRFYN